ncbi:MAG: hypothetical protein NVSMB64_15190 [Candidatus Velthaea sp.]
MSERRPASAATAVNAPLHIAVDAHDLARDERGIGRYARALLARYTERDDLRLTLMVRDLLPFRHATALRAAIGASNRVAVSNRVPRDANVVWHPWNGTFFSSPLPAVATLHDVVPFAFPAEDGRRRTAQQEPFVRTAQTARRIICDSAFTASEVRRYLAPAGLSPDVIPLGVDRAFGPGDLKHVPPGLHGIHYVLYVGAHDPHKNVATLVAGYREAFGGSAMKLVFTRPADDVPDALVCPAADTQALVALYRGATIVAVPSLYEGFGLPLLEAMACGTPVLASRAASLPEVGGDAVRYVDAPRDAAQWSSALRTLAFDPRERADLGRRGLLRAGEFTWEKCAEATLGVLAAAAHSRGEGAS